MMAAAFGEDALVRAQRESRDAQRRGDDSECAWWCMVARELVEHRPAEPHEQKLAAD